MGYSGKPRRFGLVAEADTNQEDGVLLYGISKSIPLICFCAFDHLRPFDCRCRCWL